MYRSLCQNAGLAQLARAPRCQRGGRGFEPLIPLQFSKKTKGIIVSLLNFKGYVFEPLQESFSD